MAEDDGPLPSLPEGALAFLLGQTGTLGDDPSVAPVTLQQLDDRLLLERETLATKTEVEDLLFNELVSNYGRFVTQGENAVQPLAPTYLTLQEALNNKADQTSLTPLALKSELPDLSNFVTPSQLASYVTQPDVATWLTTYLNANPSSWETLRAILLYAPSNVPLAPSPNHEWIARPSSVTLSGANVTAWADTVTNNATFNIVFSTATSVPVAANPNVCPYGIRKLAGTSCSCTSLWWKPKGTFFFVYSWNGTIPAADAILITTRNTTVSGANFHFLRNALLGFNTSTLVHSFPWNATPTDDAVGVPNIAGITYDLTTNPVKVTFLNKNLITPHTGETTIPEYTITNTSIPNVASVTGTVSALNATTATYNTLSQHTVSLCSRWGNSTNPVDATFHYFATWEDQYLTVEQMYTIYQRLKERYFSGTMTADNKGVNE